MIIGLLKESPPEQRVALIPETTAALIMQKIDVLVETGAGTSAFSPDEAFSASGARVASRAEILERADILVQVGTPDRKLISLIAEGKVWVSQFNPLWNTTLVKVFQEKGITSFSLDALPRTTRAQAMDVLSSMATVAGYKAVLEAASLLPSFFPMFMTAAGTIRPANVLILGAGVAGLQAIAIARKLGAQVEVFDVRSAVKEEVMSLGAKFVEVEGAREDTAAGGYAVEQPDDFKQRQQQAINEHAARSNVIICTAQIPGKKAPMLISKEVVGNMRPGSVIIDLAASTGGNCELSVDGQTVTHNGVRIVGQSNYPSLMPVDASKMFSKNLFNFLGLLINDHGSLNLDLNDEILKGACITHQGQIINERVKATLQP